jgi:hypothetical protein
MTCHIALWGRDKMQLGLDVGPDYASKENKAISSVLSPPIAQSMDKGQVLLILSMNVTLDDTIGTRNPEQPSIWTYARKMQDGRS